MEMLARIVILFYFLIPLCLKLFLSFFFTLYTIYMSFFFTLYTI